MKILVADLISPEGLELLQASAAVDYFPDITPDELLAKIHAYNALVVRSRTQVTAAAIDTGKNLKVIGRAGVGVDNIDVDKATEKGIIVVNAPHGNTTSTAEHTIAMITALSRNIALANYSVKKGEWKRSQFVGVELSNKVLGVIGMGRIGSEVARRARAMGMKIIGCDPHLSIEQANKIGIAMTALADLLKQADFVTLHLPLNDTTYHLLAEREMKLVKPGIRIINCARGGLIDEDALYDALVAGRVAGVALDVFEQEPPAGSNLMQLDNVIVTPHLASLTREAQVNVSRHVSEQVISALQDKPFISAVNMPAIMPEMRPVLEPFLPLMQVLGSFYLQMFGGSVDELEIIYSGDIADLPIAPLTVSCLVGFLKHIVGSEVNWVNAAQITRSRGISVRETSTAKTGNYNNLITLIAKSGQEEHRLSATLIDNEMRLVQVDKYQIDIIPARYMLVSILRNDRPGVVGKIGTLLGDENISIASMQLGQKTAEGEAMMVLQVDVHMNSAVLEKVKKLDVIKQTCFVTLENSLFIEQ